jgi:hypothetical protein
LVKKNSLHTSLTAQNSEQLVASHSHTKTQRVLFVWALDEAHTQFRVAENLDCAGPPAEPPKGSQYELVEVVVMIFEPKTKMKKTTREKAGIYLYYYSSSTSEDRPSSYIYPVCV